MFIPTMKILVATFLLTALMFGDEVLSQEEEELDAMSLKLTCTSGLREFYPLLMKKTYKIAVHANTGLDAVGREYRKVFEDYLTATAGQRFEPPIKFEMVPVTSWDLYNGVENKEFDFFASNPGLFTCIGMETGAQALATFVSRLKVREHTFDLDVYAGAIITREDRDDINTIYDLKDKIIGAGSISMTSAALTQFYEMRIAGMSYVMDPKQARDICVCELEGNVRFSLSNSFTEFYPLQVVFTHNQEVVSRSSTFAADLHAFN
mgnify:CR=1 FL=1